MTTKLHDVRTLPGGSVIITNPSEILYLATAKQAVKAEAIGMRLTRGPKITPQITSAVGVLRLSPKRLQRWKWTTPPSATRTTSSSDLLDSVTTVW